MMLHYVFSLLMYCILKKHYKYIIKLLNVRLFIKDGEMLIIESDTSHLILFGSSIEAMFIFVRLSCNSCQILSLYVVFPSTIIMGSNRCILFQLVRSNVIFRRFVVKFKSVEAVYRESFLIEHISKLNGEKSFFLTTLPPTSSTHPLYKTCLPLQHCSQEIIVFIRRHVFEMVKGMKSFHERLVKMLRGRMQRLKLLNAWFVKHA